MASGTAVPQLAVAVVGIGALLPGASSLEECWRNIVTGRDLMTDVPASRWLVEEHGDATYGTHGAFLPEVDFDPMRYGVPPSVLPATDTSQLLALMVADQVLADCADGPPADRERVSVVLGASWLERLVEASGRLQRPVWLRALRDARIAEPDAQAICDAIAAGYAPWQEETFPGLLTNVVAGRIANRFDLHGVNHTTDAACASSLAALYAAIAELSLGRSDLVITGGVDTLNDITMYTCFSQTPAMSRAGDCRPFSDAADGTMMGEGVVMFALKRLADAERDGDHVYAVIRGIGASSDGRGAAVYAPVPEGQARALRRAYEAAGYGPETVGLLEAHGTGTKAGDTAEFTALREVFAAPSRPDRQWCALGSIKSQIGHTKAAAGAAGLLKAVLALHHKVLPPTIKVGRPNPALDLDASPFYLNTEARPWTHAADHPRRAGVSSFGFGGTNFHVTVEEYRPSPGSQARPARRMMVTADLVLLSAGSPAELLRLTRELDVSRPLPVTARESRLAFRPSDGTRLAVVAESADDLIGKLSAAAARIEHGEAFSVAGVNLRTGDATPGRVGFLFPGQGSQYLGMGADLAMHLPAAQAAWDRAARLGLGDVPLDRVVFPVSVFTDRDRQEQQARLTATEWAQPALAAHSTALLAVLADFGLTPDCVAGHSFGELSALHAAGVFDADTLLRLARKRGELMRDAAAAPGAMLAVSASLQQAEAVTAVLADVWIANHNGPRQVVLSGTPEALEKAADLLSDRRIGTTWLNTVTAFHSPLVAAAKGPFGDFLRETGVRGPTCEVYAGADASRYSDDQDAVCSRLAAQLIAPVRFLDVIEAMYASGVRTFVEIGPGTVLTGLVGQILGDREHAAVPLDRKGRNSVAAFLNGVGQLAVRGVAMDVAAIGDPGGPPTVPSAPGGSGLTVKIDGGNYGRPYPPRPGGMPAPPTVAAPTPSASVSPSPAKTEQAAVTPQPSFAPPPAAPPFVAPLPAVSALIEPEPVKLSSPLPAGPLPYTAVPSPAGMPAAGAVTPPAGPSQPPAAPDRTTAVGLDNGWLALAETAQAQMAEAHTSFQHAITESHLAYLQVVGTTLSGLLGIAADLPPDVTALRELAAPIELAPLPTPARPLQAPASSPMFAPPVSQSRLSQPPGSQLAASQATAAVPPAAQPDKSGALDAAGLSSLLLSVVAERTGYPVEMLNTDMDLETDIGIDSIKKIEVLSAVREQTGDLPGLDLTTFAALHTIRAIAEKTAELASSPAAAAPQAEPPPQPQPPPAAPDHGLLSRYVMRTYPTPPAGLGMLGLASGPVAITDDETGVAPALARRLAEHGISAQVVTRVPDDARGLIVLDGLRDASSAEDAIAANYAAFRAARQAAPQLEAGGVFVTVQDTGGSFGLGAGDTDPDRAWLGGLVALARTAALEWPQAQVKAIDCARAGRGPESVAAAIADELTAGGPAIAVGLRGDGSRVTVALASAPLQPGGAAISEDSVIVATGGARGITAVALAALARRYRPRLVLLGRRPLTDEPEYLRGAPDMASLIRLLAGRQPGEGLASSPAAIAAAARDVLAVREIRQTIEEIERAGSTVRYLAVDIRDSAALAETLATVRQSWGPVTGLVHGAGVLADSLIASKTDEEFASVFSTKVDGLRALLAATAGDPLSLLCAFSSLFSCTGNPGQSDYTMANEVLNQVLAAERGRRPGCLVRSIAWGPWQGGMVTEALAERLRDRGAPLIDPQVGAEAFAAELEAPHGDVLAVLNEGDGRGMLAPADDRIAAGITVAAPRYSYLADHEIGGVPVVPVAVVLDWFTGAARSWRPQSGPVVLRDLRVLNKIALPQLADGGHRLVLRGHESPGPDDPGLDLDLRGDADAPHYRARVETNSPQVAGPWDTPRDLQASPVAYDGVPLFHGPRFQALRGFVGISAEGAEGTVVGTAALGWPGSAWRADPPAMDGGLQLATLWAQHAGTGRTLPMSVREFRVFREGPITKPVRCVVRGRKAGDSVAECDIALIDADGRPRLELLGVQLVRRPD